MVGLTQRHRDAEGACCMKIAVAIEKDEQGYCAFAPDLPGCHSQGTSFETVEISIKEAIDLYLETLSEEELAGLTRSTIYTTAYEFGYAQVSPAYCPGCRTLLSWRWFHSHTFKGKPQNIHEGISPIRTSFSCW